MLPVESDTNNVRVKPFSASPGNKDGDSPQLMMPYTCQTCARRKVRCDKTKPICASCRKSKVECIYQAPLPRRRKRKLSDTANARLGQYARILAQHGLLPPDISTSTPTDDSPHVQEPTTSDENRESYPETSKRGQLVAVDGKSIYLDSNLWCNLADDAKRGVPDDDFDVEEGEEEEEEEEEEEGAEHGRQRRNRTTSASLTGLIDDPLTGTFVASYQSLQHYHPTHAEAMTLWQMHVENVEPICKILHIPTISQMVGRASQAPDAISEADECLLFAIYQFAVFSATAEDCARSFGQSRQKMLQKFHSATRQALVNSCFLRTTEMSILQALVLFLIPGRYMYDPHTYWILTGVAIRIAQRMGLHRDGEHLGLDPFEIEMRRRLFYQLLPLDGIASQMSGTDIASTSFTWDTQPPSNINDDQIWPGMTEPPQEQKGATEMIFCLTRACVGQALVRAGKSEHSKGNKNDVELVISQTESLVEEKYIRYCNVINPLHYLTVCMARSAITAMRLRARLHKDKIHTMTDTDRRELFHLCQEILETDLAASANTGLTRYRWHLRSFFVWGSWDSLIFTITSLQKPNLLLMQTTEAAWRRIGELYNNHSELLKSKQALQIAIRRITLKAWTANPPHSRLPEPSFITALRSRSRSGRKRPDKTGGIGTVANGTEITIDETPSTDANEYLTSLSDIPGFDLVDDFSLDSVDWAFWDQMIQGYQAQGE
ncbi:hypothetical protein H2200_009793 [Cladophialophora chaetospira]|uniref:Zn(2)-C6 fungal-type domain-containing protein n=1 Tax=Cladophialophora chaetospira TaxID=386627 RepID=A0AA39CF67_9EURO|nr:hypothetical protein H2200_009793 [Cladophialophora chaetospira]